MRVCMGVVGLAVKKAGRVIMAESEPQKRPDFPLLDLNDCICSGPLPKKIVFTPEMVGRRIDEWLALKLQFDEFALSQSEKVRIYHYYVPVFLWCKREVEAHTSKFKPGNLVPALNQH